MTVKAHCDGCQQLRTIVPTGKKQKDGWSSEWWVIVVHFVNGQPCPGSGRQV